MTELHWTAGLHHDGSALYVSNPLPRLGENVTIRLRAPLDAPITAVFLRSAPDGENHLERMKITERDSLSAYWSATLPVSMPRNNYRFKILTGEGAYYLNALGVHRSDSPDWYDFKLLADFDAPGWLDDAVFYQIFPDRFHNGDPSIDVQPGEWSKRGFKTQLMPWGTPPLPYDKAGNLDFYGGDLQGIIDKIDYLKDLGVTALYLTPIFTSNSNHRYNIEDFFNVDKHLGGNEALAKLRRALDEAGMRIVLDVTPNHSSATHPWFLSALEDPMAPTAEYYTFNDHPDDYVAWLGVRSLPKLNYASQKLRDVMYRMPESVMRHWLAEPYRIDGWRLDVANMTARQGGEQFAHKVWRGMRRAVKGDNPNAYFFGENFFDGTPHLQGDELDAVMNYQGFNIPTWRWLSGFDSGTDWRPEIADNAPLPSDAYADQLDRFRASVPWVIARQQFNQLCSHDTTRILNIVNGDKALLRLGVAMLMTYPGVPCVYYGDEIGIPGGSDPDNRRCMPWDDAEWDKDLRAWYQHLMHLRRTSPALCEGGYQRLYAQGDIMVFQRQAADQRLIVVGHRGHNAKTALNIPVRHGALADGVVLTDALGSGRAFTVKDGALHLDHLDAKTALVLEAS